MLRIYKWHEVAYLFDWKAILLKPYTIMEIVMADNIPTKQRAGRTLGEMLIYQTEDGQVKLDVRLENETVWLSQQMLAELFRTTVPNISMHIKNIYDEGELSLEATVKDFLTVRREGNRDVK